MGQISRRAINGRETIGPEETHMHHQDAEWWKKAEGGKKTSNINVSELLALAEVRYSHFLPVRLLTSRCHHRDDGGGGWAPDQHSHLYPHQPCHGGRTAPRRPCKCPLPLLLVSHAAHVHRCKEIIQLIAQRKYWDLFWHQFLFRKC